MRSLSARSSASDGPSPGATKTCAPAISRIMAEAPRVGRRRSRRCGPSGNGSPPAASGCRRGARWPPAARGSRARSDKGVAAAEDRHHRHLQPLQGGVGEARQALSAHDEVLVDLRIEGRERLHRWCGPRRTAWARRRSAWNRAGPRARAPAGARPRAARCDAGPRRRGRAGPGRSSSADASSRTPTPASRPARCRPALRG